jgi:type IV pilus assembly protein PilB
MKEDQIKEILLRGSYITEEDVQKSKEYKGSLVDFFFDQKVLTKDIFGEAIAEHFDVPYIDLEEEKIKENVLFLIPEIVARANHVIIFERDKEIVKIGTTDPSNLKIINSIKKKFGQEVEVYYITPQDLRNALLLYRGTLRDKFNEIFKKLNDDSLEQEVKDNLIVELVEVLLEYGQQSRASDIHLEPYKDNVRVRFRVDGAMHKVLEISKELYSLVLARIKILSRIPIDEHDSAQDGKLNFKFNGQDIDVRVSIVPITGGENTVLRLLSSQGRQFNLSNLGLSKEPLKLVEETIKDPYGMILVTGPTGSGKTTTLYSVLKMLNNPDVHISTIENPVEYDIHGVSQIQVNAKTGLTFARGLRSIVRQDPDIIMVGEIRDEETADIAVNSALTGHLVLSTLHTNNAATTLPRLINMKIKPFLVSSTVNLVIAQRLVRKICTKCRRSYQLNKEEINSLKYRKGAKDFLEKNKKKKIKEINFYKGNGCNICDNTGYKGRIGIFEVLEITDEIKELIIKKSSSDVLMKKAKDLGMETMMEDGLKKALSGITTLDEVLKTVKD